MNPNANRWMCSHLEAHVRKCVPMVCYWFLLMKGFSFGSKDYNRYTWTNFNSKRCVNILHTFNGYLSLNSNKATLNTCCQSIALTQTCDIDSTYKTHKKRKLNKKTLTRNEIRIKQVWCVYYALLVNFPYFVISMSKILLNSNRDMF